MSLDSRIVLKSRKNKGLVVSLNEGLTLAKGKYIARMDADDISLPLRFEKQLDFLEKNVDVGVCGTWVQVFGDDFKSKLWRMPVSDKRLKPKLIFSVPFAHPSVMMRKDTINQSGVRYNYEYKCAEDYKFWVDLSLHTKFANLPEVLLKHRYHRESVSRIADSREDGDRYCIISAIQSELLESIEVRLSSEEQRRHFIISLNERTLKEGVDLMELNRTFELILRSNRNFLFFDQKSLYFLLARKYFVASILTHKNNMKGKSLGFALFRPMLMIGAALSIKDRLSLKNIKKA